MENNKITDGTVGKAMFLLDVIAAFEKPAKFRDIQAASPFPKASTHRLVTTLLNQNLLAYDERTERYSLGGRLMRLASKAWRNASLAPIAAPFIDKLSEQTGQTIHLAKLDNGQVLYLDKRNANRPIPMFSDAGKIGPVYCTGVGKAMLAFSTQETISRVIKQQSFYKFTEHTLQDASDLESELEEIRQDGFALDREEHELGIICIAVPILSSNNIAVAGMSITLSTREFDLSDLKTFKPFLDNTAKEISLIAGDWLLDT